MDAESHAELTCTFQGRCHYHAFLAAQEGKVKIRHVDVEAGRWTARGAGVCGFASRDGTPCRIVCTIITEHLPLEFQSLPCPDCNRVVKYRYKLECVQMNEEEFVFTASISCPRCKRRSVFRKIVQSLHYVKRVRIGPTGLELETRD
jgi:hypothetical protein